VGHWRPLGFVLDSEKTMLNANRSAHCAQCPSKSLCWPIGLDDSALERIERTVSARIKIKRGDTLVRHGERFKNVYAVHTGFFKTSVYSSDGREQVTGFHMAGEFMGLDGVVHEQHTCDAVALEDSEVCVLPFDQLESLTREIPLMQRHVHKLMSQEIVRESSVMLLLGASKADERIAAVLLNLTRRLHARGFSPSELVLRMTREELGSFLCIKLETVSRAFSKFAAEGILEVKQRHIRILDVGALQDIVQPQTKHLCRTPAAVGKPSVWSAPTAVPAWSLPKAWLPQATSTY
jgi:CRP/FNR family transcriptional regulator